MDGLSRRNDGILIIGGRGYIGSYLASKFPGCKVLDLKDGNDYTDSRTLGKFLKGTEIVINCAGIVGEKACDLYPDIAMETNYKGVQNLARLMTAFGIKKLMQLSTCSIYGPETIYSRSKKLAESFLKAYTHVDSIILRLGTVYGVSPNTRWDTVANKITKEALTKGEFNIYGGEQWRPFLYLGDLYGVIKNIIKNFHFYAPGTVMDVVSQNLSMRQLGEIVSDCTNAIMNLTDMKEDNRDYKGGVLFGPQGTINQLVMEVNEFEHRNVRV